MISRSRTLSIFVRDTAYGHVLLNYNEIYRIPYENVSRKGLSNLCMQCPFKFESPRVSCYKTIYITPL